MDGFIIVSSENTEGQIRHLKEKNIPFVLLDRYYPDIQTDFVSINNFKASYDASNHLIKAGYQKIGLIGYDSKLFHMQERIRGYLQSLKEHNLPLNDSCLKRVIFQDVEKGVKVSLNEMLSCSPSRRH